MRYYFPEKPLFRWFRQKGECTKLPLLSNITLDRAAPKSSGAAPAAAAKAPALAQPEPGRNAGAHAFLDQMEAVHKAYKWLTVAPPPKPQAATPAAAVSLADKPHRTVEPIDLQDMPATLECNGFKQISATLMRKWFANPKYAVQTQAQKDCVFGAAFYPPGLVDASSLKHKDLLQYERARLAYEKLKTPEFMESKTARDALQRILRKTPAGTVDIDATLEFDGDLQKMHRKYAFVSITVGKQFPQNFEDIRVEDLEKSRNHTDDLELALGEFRWYAAIDRAHVFYNGRTTRRIQVQSVALYAMAPYGFDDLDNTLEYRGHFNKKHLALVSTGTWVNYPVYMGRDMYAKNAILQPAFNQDFRQWSDKHGQGGDMLLFSERMRPFIQPIDVMVPFPEQLVFGIYYQTPDGAFKRALETEIRELGLGSDVTVIVREVRHEDEFKDAWSYIAKYADEHDAVVLLGLVFTHASKPTGDNSGLEFYPSPNSDATVKRAELQALERLPWAPSARLDLRGCNTGTVGAARSWSPASVLAASQGIATIGQTGYSYFSSQRDHYQNLEPTSPNAYLWAYKRGKNDHFGDGLKMQPKVER